MKAKTRKIEIAKTERRSKRKIRRKEKEKGIEEEEKDRNKEDSGKVGKMGRKIRDSKIREESRKVDIRMIPQVDQIFWEKSRKMWNHIIDLKERFILRKGKIYLLSKEKREEEYLYRSK